MAIPSHSKYVVVGSGIHGLSVAYHLALQLKAQGKGSGKDILVVDKQGVAAGASGIACGVIRNNYFQPAMRELMMHSVEIWESDPETYCYCPVGYMQISPESMHEEVGSIAQQQRDIGYESEFIEGEQDCMKYMKGLFHDWQACQITSVLHEKRGGYANNIRSMQGLAAKAESLDVRIVSGVKVTGFRSQGGAHAALTAVETNRGAIECDYVVLGAGPWIRDFWKMLGLSMQTEVRGPDGVSSERPTWVYWCLQEGTLEVDPSLQKTNDGQVAPVLHVDSDARLYSIQDGSLLTDCMWGIYYKADFYVRGVQGGTVPYQVETDPEQVQLDPYGHESTEHVVSAGFADLWVSALAHCQKRFEGTFGKYRREKASGGLGAFTPDSFPIFDVFRENCYIIADSNHGYKMLGVGKLVAEEICGTKSRLLEPFRFSRYQEGKLHPLSNSPFPWS